MSSFELFKVNDKEAQVCLGDGQNDHKSPKQSVVYIECLLNVFEVILMLKCNDSFLIQNQLMLIFPLNF